MIMCGRFVIYLYYKYFIYNRLVSNLNNYIPLLFFRCFFVTNNRIAVSIHIRTKTKPIGSPRKNNSNTLLSNSDSNDLSHDSDVFVLVSCEFLFEGHGTVVAFLIPASCSGFVVVVIGLIVVDVLSCDGVTVFDLLADLDVVMVVCSVTVDARVVVIGFVLEITVEFSLLSVEVVSPTQQQISPRPNAITSNAVI